MFRTNAHRSIWAVAIAGTAFATAGLSRAAQPVNFSGGISGIVKNSQGVPQMGATVVLYNRQERVAERALSDDRGEFRFVDLMPDIYSIRVALASFVPAIRKGILVQPGMQSVLDVHLNTLFSSIQIAYPPAGTGSLMSDDWKWILRSASSTRPVLRFTPESASTQKHDTHPALFSDTRGVLQLSAGDSPLVTGIGSEANLGTAFALATSLFGSNHLEFSGNLGYGSQTGVPAAAFRTAYKASGPDGPEVSVTMRQLLLPSHGSGAVETALPALRTVSASLDERTELSDRLLLQYGFTLDSVSFGDRLNYFSPYARLRVSLDDRSELTFAFTSGNARPDLAGDAGLDSDFQRDLNTIGLFPRISLSGGNPRIQRGEEFELAYSRKIGSRKYEVLAYRESVANAALSLVAPAGFEMGGDILPDMFAGNAIFDAGNYESTGYSAAVTQNFGENFSATLMYGTMSGLTAERGELVTGGAEELRSMIHAARRQAATARIAGTIPGMGTHVIASYQWLDDQRWVTPGRLYTTQALRPMPGLNVYVRQPIPGLTVLPWRMEAIADLRNLLAEGYLPFDTVGGQQIVLVQTPRSFRGGLNFIF